MSVKTGWQRNMMSDNCAGATDLDAAYDYIIVGGGTGGLAIASRLAEDPAVSVAVVEAGGDDLRPINEVPDPHLYRFL